MSKYDQINLTGGEIEGRWETRPDLGLNESQAYIDPETDTKVRKGLMYDGSVTFHTEEGEPIDVRGRLGSPIDTSQPNIGEAVSDPLPPESLMNWLKDVYPDEVNQTCGLHVHFSFPPPNYQLLMDREFWTFFYEKAHTWGENHKVPDRYWRRLEGNNDTCRAVWDPDEQMHGGHDFRYRIWNFHAFRSHGTAECRLMPAFQSPDLAVESVRFLCDLVQEYLEGRSMEDTVLAVHHKPEPSQKVTTKTF